MIRTNREYRNRGEYRAEDDFMVEGYASTFEPYEMYNDGDNVYYERIDPHAFDNADMSDVIFVVDHTGRVYARTKNNSIELSVDDKGLYTRTNLGLTEGAKAVYEDIKVGNYYQMSFAFTVAEDHFDRDTRTRVIDKIAKVFDISCVSFPANPGTNIDVSTRDYFNGVIEAEKAERLERERTAMSRRRLQVKIKIEMEK